MHQGCKLQQHVGCRSWAAMRRDGLGIAHRDGGSAFGWPRQGLFAAAQMSGQKRDRGRNGGMGSAIGRAAAVARWRHRVHCAISLAWPLHQKERGVNSVAPFLGAQHVMPQAGRPEDPTIWPRCVFAGAVSICCSGRELAVSARLLCRCAERGLAWIGDAGCDLLASEISVLVLTQYNMPGGLCRRSPDSGRVHQGYDNIASQAA